MALKITLFEEMTFCLYEVEKWLFCTVRLKYRQGQRSK